MGAYFSTNNGKPKGKNVEHEIARVIRLVEVQESLRLFDY